MTRPSNHVHVRRRPTIFGLNLSSGLTRSLACRMPVHLTAFARSALLLPPTPRVNRKKRRKKWHGRFAWGAPQRTSHTQRSARYPRSMTWVQPKTYKVTATICEDSTLYCCTNNSCYLSSLQEKLIACLLSLSLIKFSFYRVSQG